MALDLIGSAYVTDSRLIAENLRYWLRVHVDIVDEYEELLVSPIRMIREIEDTGGTFGDCDDVTMLAASILASCGAEIKLVAVCPQPDGSFAHVILKYRFPRMEDFVDFDATRDDNYRGYPEQVLTLEVIS